MSYVTGNTIRTLRIKHGITQKELAEKLNVSDKTISKWETETAEEEHSLFVETVDNEFSIVMKHSMSKGHYVSFIAYVTSGSVEIVKLYPEQDISIRFRKKGHGFLYGYCNRHGLFKKYI